MDIIQIIERKKLNGALSRQEIEFFISGATDGSIPDYQLAALLMAIRLNGVNRDETAWLTMAMARSGDMLDLSQIEGIPVDKHSTGGVGDTTTLIVAPLVAACGVAGGENERPRTWAYGRHHRQARKHSRFPY